MDRITNHIFIGDWESSIDREQLINNDIKTIICVNDRFKSSKNMYLYEELNINHYHIQEYDIPLTNLLKYFNKTNKIIKNSIKNEENVLVHCTMGISRSTTIVLSYLLYSNYINNNNTSEDEKLKILYNYVKSKRDIVYPNIGFHDQLKSYENILINNNKKKSLKNKFYLLTLMGLIPFIFYIK